MWFRQELFDQKLILRLGKTVPTFDFGNVVKPIALNQKSESIPAVSGLLYTPLFVNPTMLGVIPGYYNSAYGLTVNFAPIKKWYASYGVYDGNLARGVQTGIKVGPTFNSSYLNIGETGLVWLLGKQSLPGNIGVGVWHQTGPIKSPPAIHDIGATGTYLFGAQRLWFRHPGIDNSGISAFFQYGINNSSALPFKKYTGAGFTAFGLIPSRSDDSLGFGGALSWLNQNLFKRHTELMFQAYYQAKIAKALYLEPALSYIPTPGDSRVLGPAWAGTLRAMLFF